MVDSPVRAFLQAAVEAGVSPLVTGAPGVGKTTLLRALGNAIPWNNVVITVEDERELGLHLPRWDPVQQQLVKRHAVCRPFESRLPNAEGRGGFDMGDALHLALRASPTWVLVGEVRGAYVTSLLEAATSGIASVMCTIHSPSAEGVFDKVLINALKAHPTPSTELVLRSLAALGLVVHVERDRSYSRFVSGIYELGAIGDSGRPDLRPVFAPRAGDGRAQATGPGMLSEPLAEKLNAVGFDSNWLHPGASDWPADPHPLEAAS
ncbi:CpaF/VirB11 family protein [Modestobacter sp. VKM Ac-2978]|uniref:CpaF/VirB11 family protein n=1 Tax=Modestobacter sp. VKM Ac-2978 TaxID=3004132 RepID=UPI0022AA5BAD|nr:CpaF/VirB11 family protein [Modestobacter sp. VKM Ac-2978]MCZ2849722.1 CpaF/VirB11 family protein [Modestobacter sp. VKM Ac-2978]